MLQFANAWKIDLVSGEQTIINEQKSFKKSFKPNVCNHKNILKFLKIKHSCLNGFDQLLHSSSKVLNLRVDFRLTRKQQINSKRSFLASQNLKWSFPDASIAYLVDGYFSYNCIVRLIVLVLVK